MAIVQKTINDNDNTVHHTSNGTQDKVDDNIIDHVLYA